MAPAVSDCFCATQHRKSLRQILHIFCPELTGSATFPSNTDFFSLEMVLKHNALHTHGAHCYWGTAGSRTLQWLQQEKSLFRRRKINACVDTKFKLRLQDCHLTFLILYFYHFSSSLIILVPNNINY